MSEPLSSTEIEDVLSSIRRLVSEDMRPVPRAAGVATAPLAGEKLILTPALRVVETEAAEAVPKFVAAPRVNLGVDQAEPRSEPPVDPAQSLDEAPISQVLASLGAAVDAQGEDFEDEAAAPDYTAPQDWGLPTTDDESLDEVYVAETFADPNAEAAFDAAPAPAVAESTVAESTVAETIVAQEETVVPGWAQSDFSTEEDDDDASEGVMPPDLDPVWAAAAEASVIAALSGAEDKAQEPRFAEDDAEPEELRFDEEVLRDLVRDILREELAGSMGERITRNIRKLVRTEIARALAAQDLS